MNKKKCPRCGSPITKRNGTRNGVQLYKCQACGRQFRAGEKLSDEHLWYLYQFLQVLNRRKELFQFIIHVSRCLVRSNTNRSVIVLNDVLNVLLIS